MQAFLEGMLDTLSIARRLSESGLKREQVEVHADVITDAVGHQNGNHAIDDFACNQIDIVLGEINNQITDLRGDMNSKVRALDAKISASEPRLVCWIVGAGLVVVRLCSTA